MTDMPTLPVDLDMAASAPVPAPRPRSMTVIERLEQMIERSGRSQREIAAEVGYRKSNVISMMKKGDMPVPFDKAAALARACGEDPTEFARLVVREYQPELWEALEHTFGPSLSATERRVIEIAQDELEEGLMVNAVNEARLRACLRGFRAADTAPGHA